MFRILGNYCFLGVVLLALPASALAQQASQPKVFAAWTQVIGTTATPTTNDFAPPKVEMRFVVAKGSQCDQFVLMPTETTETILPSQAVVPVEWAADPLAVRVCRAPMADTWVAASLLYADKVTQVTVTSMINYGIEKADLTNPARWVAGPSNDQPIQVPGPAAIGQHGDLKIVTLGDTGCRGDDGSGRHFQDCSNAAATGSWPLESVAVEAASLNDSDRSPDLVIHVGDYRYFLERHIHADSWDLWRKDFFPAAQPLLMDAPWAFGRGNHEGCPGTADLTYGIGYFQFFGTKADPDCASLKNGLMKPWYFDVPYDGAAAKDAHRFIVIDANTYSFSGPFPADQAKLNFEIAKAMSDNGPASSWWVWHSPGVQLLHYNHRDHFGDGNVLTALLKATGEETTVQGRYCGQSNGPACKPSQFLLGHQHLYQDVTFPGPSGDWIFPRQYIIGHGGVDIDTKTNPARVGNTCFDGDFPIGAKGANVTGQVQTFEKHGVIYWERSANTLDMPAGWSRSYAWADGVVDAPKANPNPDYSANCK